MATLPLPHQTNDLFLTDGGTETWLMYKRGFELKEFAAFHLLHDPKAKLALQEYYRTFAEIAARHRASFIFDSLTYRASRDWGRRLGYSDAALAEMNHACFALYRDAAHAAGLPASKTVISGCIGPRGDAYKLNRGLTAEDAETYHSEQIATFKSGGVDIVTALTLNTTAEAVGIARAALSADLPSVISFTLEKNRRLKSGESLREAIETVETKTDGAPAYYMINCSHPTDFGPALAQGAWSERIQGLRANASSLDHGTLCQLGHLEEGDPNELAKQYAEIRSNFPRMNVFGGCCGTDFKHVDKIATTLLASV